MIQKPTQQTRERFHLLLGRLHDPLLTALTIMLAILMFVIAPLQGMGLLTVHYFGVAFALVLIVAIFAVSNNFLAVAAALIAVGLTVVTTVLRHRQPSLLDVYLDACAWVITGLTLGIVVTRAVFAPGRVTIHRIVGAVLLYLNFGLTFMGLYCLGALMVPNAFSGLEPLKDDLSVSTNLIYFSFVTLTSVGYGDIAPLHPFVRSLANVEAIIGQLFPATLLARLVTLEIAGRGS